MRQPTISSSQSEVGYIWFSPVKSTKDPIIEMHTCCRPGWERKWLTKEVIRAGYRLVDQSGARYVIAIHSDHHVPLEKLGFDTGDVNILDVKELDHGESIGKRLWRSRDTGGSG